jgi:hypothetical protein
MDKKVVDAQRRRRTQDSGSGPRERAETPSRRRPQSPQRPTSRPSGTSSGGGSSRPPIRPSLPSSGHLPSGSVKLSPIAVGILVLLFICVFITITLFGGGDGSDQSSEQAYIPPTATPFSIPTEPVALPTPATPRPLLSPAAVDSGDPVWLVMLYQDADDKVLEQDIYVDLNEAERVGSSDRVHIVAQVDRFRAGFQGDGDWSSTRRFYITEDGDLERVRSQGSEIGEINMADGNSLVDFVTWAVQTYPANRYVLILSDHGTGWPGGWSDPDPGGRGDPSIPISQVMGDQLYLHELDTALETIRANTSVQQFELIGLDACLMAHLEVFSALAPHARYAVASQEVEPALGWAYTSFLQALRDDPGMDGAELAQRIVDTYIQADQRIVDDQARADLLRQGSPMGSILGMFAAPSAEQIAQQMGQGITLTAVDLSALPDLLDQFNDFVFSLQQVSQPQVARARSYTQSFTSIFGDQVPPSYIDLGHFAQLVANETGDQNVAQRAESVMTALNNAVIAEKHGPKKPGATGMSVYFPNSKLFQSPITGSQSYTAVANRFSEVSLWDEFLAFHYAGRPFERTAAQLVVPEAGTLIRAPGAEQIQLSPVTVSSSTAAPGSPITLSTDISGPTIGYVYLFVGYFDQQANSIFLIDSDYLESDVTRELEGIYYPHWPDDGVFTLRFTWEPIVFAINDGSQSVVAHFTPRTFGASFEEAMYTVDGIYTFADGGEARSARLYFSNGVLQQVYTFTGDSTTGAPHETYPQPGDSFTVIEEWMDLDSQGRSTGIATQPGNTLTFGKEMFTWKELDAAAGPYVVGFIVEDLDGNRSETYATVTVE